MSSSAAQHDATEDLLELTFEAFRVAHQASVSAAEGIATSSLPVLRSIREREKELDTLDRDIDDLVTATITKVPEANARELLACMKLATSLERIGDLLLSFATRAEASAARMDAEDLRELTLMASHLERMLASAEAAFRERNLDRAISVLRADGEIDRLRNVITFRHLEPKDGERRSDSFHVLFMAQEIERAGDHAKNMAEEVCHLVSGRTVRHVLRSYDRSVEQLFLEHLRQQHAV
jgi:phosphate transport system protein